MVATCLSLALALACDPTEGWVSVTAQSIAPQDAAYIRVEFRLFGTGTLWADDVIVAEDASATNLALNPDFESEPSGSYDSEGSATFTWASDAFRSASHSLRIESESAVAGEMFRWSAKSKSIPATPGTGYNVSVWVRTKAVSEYAELAFTFRDANDVHIMNSTRHSEPVSGDTVLPCTTESAPASPPRKSIYAMDFGCSSGASATPATAAALVMLAWRSLRRWRRSV